MEIKIIGYGTEILVGHITQQQYDFWSNQSTEALISHMYHEEDIIEVPDDCAIGGLFGKANIVHFYGADILNSSVRVEVDGRVVLSGDLQPALGEAKIIKSVDVNHEQSDGHFFIAKLTDYGEIMSINSEDDAFNINKLLVSTMKFNNQYYAVALESYDGEDAELGDVNSKLDFIRIF